MLFLFALISFFLFDLLYILLGLLFVRFNWTHRFGLRLLSMSLFYPKSLIPCRCTLDCSVTQCRNWTCSNYHKSVNSCANTTE